MLNGAKFRYFIPVIATLLLCLVSQSADSAPGAPSKEGLQKTSQAEVRKVPNGGAPTKANIKRAATADRSRDTAVSKKFQARMGSEQQQQQQSPQAPLQESYYMSSDSWNPHSLIPTFTDHEQGDEMVALASSEPEPDQYKQPNMTRSMVGAGQSIQKYDQRYSEAGKATDGSSSSHPVTVEKHRQQADEYYPDDEEDEEDSMKGLRGEFESVGNQDRKERNSKVLRAMQQAESGQYNDDSVQPPLTTYDQGGYRNGPMEQPTLNISQPKQSVVAPSPDARWLPSSDSQIGLSLNLNQASAGNQQQFSSEQQRTREDAHSQKGSGEKLTNLFGGRDTLSAFSKTDAAIEYLRNLLKSKQNSRNNSTSEPSPSSAYAIKQQVDQNSNTKNSNLQKLSSFASKLSHMLNSTSAFEGSSNSSKFEYAPSTAGTRGQGSEFSLVQQQQKLSPVGQQTDAKFSIVDAKPMPSQTEGTYQTQMHFSSTTKSPNEEAKPNRQQANPNPLISASFFASTQAEPNKPEPYSQELSPSNTPNGTPLGGDYIESLDDFPRGLRQQQLYSSETRLVSVVQQDAKLDQSSTSPDELNASHSKDQAHVKHAQPSRIDPMHTERESFEAFQRQISGVPSSSKYFQMLTPSSEHSQRQPGRQLAPYPEVTKNSPAPAKERAQKFVHPRPPTVQHHHNSSVADQTETQNVPAGKPRLDESRRQQVIAHYEQPQPLLQSFLEQHNQQQASISSKIYTNEQTLPSQSSPTSHSQQPHPLAPKQALAASAEPTHMVAPPETKVKPPKIISYNYFESPTENGESELMTTNYQLGDTLYSSTGGVEQILSNTELEAIQNQFLTAEHPIVPIGAGDQMAKHQHQASAHQDQSLTGLLTNLRPNREPDMLQRLNSPAEQVEGALKELASNEEQVSVAAPHSFNQPQGINGQPSGITDMKKPSGRRSDPSDAKKKKSLIVYLNHPRPVDMSKVSSPDEGYSLSQSIGDPQTEPFISAKEFDIHGLSKDTKHLDISNVRGELGDLKDGHDKDGLSVVVIGDAYKYKKIVLLISSKSGGLKFIPMVKDMKK